MDATLLHDMARRVPGAGEVSGLTSGPLGFFSGGMVRPPMVDDAVALAVDLDVVNLAELRALTGCEDEHAVIKRLYEQAGPDFVRHLRGGFALALWDRRRSELLLAVDHFGMRRLYHTSTPDGLAFASRPAALLAAPGLAIEIEPAALYQYLNFGFIPSPHSIFRGVHRLPPGCRLIARDGQIRTSRYWDLTYPERSLSIKESVLNTVRLTENAVALAIEGAPAKTIGAFLSGGTDSSTVVGVMRKLTGERVNAFSIGFKEARYNELDYAELSARHFDAAHYVHIVTPEEALAVLPSLVEAYDEPFGNDSAIGTFLCARLARECGVTRLLAGDGGDEIFGGNERYATDRVFARYQHIPVPLRRGLLEPLLLGLADGGSSILGKAQRYVRRANIPNPQRFFVYEFFFAQEGQALLAPELLRSVRADAPWILTKERFDEAQAQSELNRLLYLDMKFTIGDNDLLKVVRTADLAGVGVRFPFLDLSLVEFTGTWPAHFKVRGLDKRYLFKRAFRPLLPGATLAKRKHGFGVPTSLWLKTHEGFSELAHGTLRSSDTRLRGYLREGAIDELFALHKSDTTPFYGDVLWNLLMLELWHRRHIGTGGSA